jgi:DNA primase
LSRFVDFKALKERVSIEEVLSYYGLLEELKRSHDTLTGRCPIHKGNSTTSFKVSLSRNLWNCFGPCKGGNILDLVAQLENVEIREAALLIAERFSVQAAKPTRARASPAPSQLEATAQPEPRANPPLRFERLQHLDPNHASVRRLGFAQSTIEHFEAGRCSVGIMRGRIAIPIHNANGGLVAYVGKATTAAQEERYKYPDGFRKELEVYNLHRAARSQRLGQSGLIVTSGFLDAFRIHEAGFDNVVALLGFTASPEQLSALHRVFGGRPHAALIVKQNPAIGELLSRLCPQFFVRLVALDRHPGDLSTSDTQQALS